MTIRRAVLLLLLCAGCGMFSRQEKEYFSLETIAPESSPGAAAGLPVGIDAVELPPAVDRREIVARDSDGHLDLRGTELWAGPFEAMVIHTLAFDLAGRLPEGMVILPGQSKPAAMRSINLIIEELEAGPDPILVLDARWILRAQDSAGTTHHERIAIDLASLESAEIASGTSRALAALADRIVAELGGQGP